MPIFEQSRYETADVVPIADSTGVFYATVVPTRTIYPPASYTRHLVKQGDRFDILAFTAYGDAEFWWVIADANPQVLYPDDLMPGSVLKIPIVRVTP